LGVAVILVTGGTGTLGTRVVAELVTRRHTVRVLSRRAGPGVDGATRWVGDVRTGEGLDAAVSGVDVVVHAAAVHPAVMHAASKPRRSVQESELAGTANILAAARPGGAHVIYVSIVGVDRHRFSYYRAKRAAELLVESYPGDWAILRATQFHQLLARLLSYGVFFRTPNLAFQPIDAGDVAGRLVALAESRHTGHMADYGGPEVLSIAELVDIKRRCTGRATRLVPLPAVSFIGDFDRRLHCTPEHLDGTVTWEAWWRTQTSA
jgi:uncharacterized protein YbjT (DUF2867 family)